jgi:hypothetical protein
MSDDTVLFKAWAETMGFNNKELSQAGDLIGVKYPTLARRLGDQGLSKTERLAMAAIRAGLSPWTPKADREASVCREVLEILARETAYIAEASLKPTPDPKAARLRAKLRGNRQV